MAKTLHSRQNSIFLTMLRGLREARHLRQADLADLVGRSQAMVSNVERGERTLDLIELREWLEALEVDFISFLSTFDAELRNLGAAKRHPGLRKRADHSRPTNALQSLAATITEGDH